MADNVHIFDSADRVPPPPPGRHPLTPISGADFDQAPRRRLPLQAWILLTAILAAILLWLGYRLDESMRGLFLRYPWVGDGLLWFVLAALVLGVLGGLFTLAARAWVGVQRYRLVRSRLGAWQDAVQLARLNPFLIEQQAIDLERERSRYAQYPNLSTLSQPAPKIVEVEPAALPAPASEPLAETLDELERRGIVRSSDYSLFLGYGEDRPGDLVNWAWSVDGGANEAAIAAVAGAPGSGKSYTAANIISLALRKGVQVYLFDPQRDSHEGQTLAALCRPALHGLAAPIAAEPDELLAMVKKLNAIGEARESGEDTSKTPVLGVFDEFAGTLLDLGRDAGEVIHDIIVAGSKYRKFNVRWLLCGPSWKANIVGGEYGTTLASLIRLKVLHGMSPTEAGFLTYGLEKQQRKEIEGLTTGWAMVYGPGGMIKRTHIPPLQPRLMADVALRLQPRPQPPLQVIDARSPRQKSLDDIRKRCESLPRTERLRIAAKLAAQGAKQREIQYACIISDEAAGDAWRAAQDDVA